MREAIKNIMDTVTDELVITSTGTISREVFNYKDRAENFYVTGSLGASLGIGLGLALNIERNVIVIAGDGDILMSLGTLVLANRLNLKNFKLYIIDNNSYAATGCQSTCSDVIDFTEIADCKVIKVKATKTDAWRINLSAQKVCERFYDAINSSRNPL